MNEFKSNRLGQSEEDTIRRRPIRQQYAQRAHDIVDDDNYISLSSIKIHNALQRRFDEKSNTKIIEFIENQEIYRNRIMKKGYHSFGNYSDSIGHFKKSVFFSENRKGTLCLRFSPDGKQVVAGFGSGTIKLFDAKSYDLVHTIRVGKENGYATSCIRYLPKRNDIFYVSSADGTVVCYNLLKDDFNIVINEAHSEINAFDINSTATELATGGSDNDVKVYDVKRNILINSFKNKIFSDGQNNFTRTEFHSNRVQAIKFHPDHPNIILSGGWDNMLKIWDLRIKYGCVQTIFGPHISGDAIDVLGTTILTGSWEPTQTIKLWDLRTYTAIQDVFTKNDIKLLGGVYTFGVAYFDDDKTGDLILHTSLGTKAIDVISISQSVVLYSFVCGKSTVSVDSHGPHIVSGGTNNAFHFIDFFMNILLDYREKQNFIN